MNIDFYNNSYTLTGITGYALTTPLSYDMTVSLSQSGDLDISYSDIYSYDSGTRRWSKTENFGFYNFNKASSDVSARMVAIATNSANYDKYEKAAMADIKFISSILKNFTGLAFGDFIEKYAKGSIFNISGNISDVQQANNQIDGTTYKYLVTLTQRLNESSDSAYYSSFLSDYVYCRLYTNEDSVIRLSRTSVVSVQGKLVGATQGSGLGANVYLNLIDP